MVSIEMEGVNAWHNFKKKSHRLGAFGFLSPNFFFFLGLQRNDFFKHQTVSQAPVNIDIYVVCQVEG